MRRVLALLALASPVLVGMFGLCFSPPAARVARSSAGIRVVGGRHPLPVDRSDPVADPRSGRSRDGSFPVLPPFEEAIVRQPFAPKAARIRLARLVASLRPGMPSSHRHGMGWAQPDREYWQRIPAAARQIPTDWSRLPVVRFTNSEIGGVREVRLRRGPEYDQWLLRDPLHHLRACISVRRATRRVYFMQVGRQADGQWGLKVADDLCYSCHPSGPRVIRPLDEPRADQHTLARFNRLILSYGACDFGDSVPAWMRACPNDEPSCRTCHDGIRRGRLYSVHHRPIRFKVEQEETMPPA